MLSEYVQSIAGSTTLGLISLIVAFTAFAAIVVWALRMDRGHLRKMSELPLDRDSTLSHHQEQGHP